MSSCDVTIELCGGTGAMTAMDLAASFADVCLVAGLCAGWVVGPEWIDVTSGSGHAEAGVQGALSMPHDAYNALPDIAMLADMPLTHVQHGRMS